MDKKAFLSNQAAVCLIACFCCFLWGSAFPALKIGFSLMNISAGDSASEILFAGIRFAAAGVMVIAFLSAKQRKFVRPTARELPAVLIISLFQTVLQYFFYYIGLARISGVKAAVLVGSNVFAALIISCLLFRMEKLTVKKLVGCVLGFAGVVLVNTDSFKFDFTFTLLGEGFILLSTVAYAFSSVFMKKFSAKSSPSMLSGWQFFLGGLIMAAGGAAFGGRLGGFTVLSALLLGYLSLLSAVAYTLWSMLLEFNPVSKVTVYGFANPVFGVLLSALILGETAQAFQVKNLAALVLVCVGIYIVNRKNISINEAEY